MKIIILALLLILSVPIYSQDTIRVMMTYSDTTLTELVGVDDEGEEYSVIGYDEYVYWRRGYVVREYQYKDFRTDDGPPGAVWKDVYFLDERKERISITNIVWNYKIN